MAIGARGLNRATLARQLLLEREPLSVVDAVHRIVAVQAQEPASPYVALWSRIAGFDPADLDAAYASHAVVKASLLRITLHAVTAADYPAFQHALVFALRASRLNDRRYTDTGLTAADAEALVPDLLAFAAEPRTNADVDAWIEDRLGRPEPRLWWALRTFAPVVHAGTGAVWSHGYRPAYRAAPSSPPTGDPAPSERHLVRRYLEGFGPATAQDVGQLTFLRMPMVTTALDALVANGEVVRLEGPTKAPLYDVPDGLRPDEDTPAPPRLLPMWDSVLLAYADRSRLLPDEHRPHVIRRNGDVLPTLLVDGRVVGVWRPAPDAGGSEGIEATAFEPLPDDAWAGLATEAAALHRFLADRDPAVYRRYARWWPTLPAAEVRVLSP